MDGQKVLQQMGDVSAMVGEVLQQMGEGGTGKMQQDIAIIHGRWTTVNDATAIYGSYRKSCNKVPCTLPSVALQ